jgi:hypothetical protein
MKNYKVKAIENFTYTDFRDVVFLEKENYNYNWIYKGDVFLCDKDRYEYLTGNNAKKMVVVKLDGILVEEEKQDTEKEEVASKEKTTRKRANKKEKK